MDTEPVDPADGLAATLVDAIAALDRPGVSYALIGGLATGYHSRPRYTNDVDLLLDLPQVTLPAVLEDLRNRGFEFDLQEVVAWITGEWRTVFGLDDPRMQWLLGLTETPDGN
jgi:hypothetical protein